MFLGAALATLKTLQNSNLATKYHLYVHACSFYIIIWFFPITSMSIVSHRLSLLWYFSVLLRQMPAQVCFYKSLFYIFNPSMQVS